VFDTPDTPTPEVQLLSNGRYHVMVTNAGGGYSRWKDLAVTRWREDTTCDNWGTFCYIRDVAAATVWSTAYQPTLRPPDHYEAIFSEGRAEFRRRDHFEIETYTEIVVSPEDDIELRRVRLTNRSRTRRRSRSPATPKWCSRRRAPTPCIRRSATCSCRPRSLRDSRPSCARGGRARRGERRRGCCT
jgi:cellobiose phosphorylase